MKEPWQLSLTEASSAIHEGSLSSYRLVKSCIHRIQELEDKVQAWAHLDIEGALESAGELDRTQIKSRLHGIPVGIKDVIDTASLPTSYNSPIYENHFPKEDAVIVKKLVKAGMVILGKTVTQEFATRGKAGPTRNPNNLAHTPGGSSSGSAAAVACGMIPLAVSTQTAGSIIRPASYCGVVGFKPSSGWTDHAGLKTIVPEADTIGFHCKTVDDAEWVWVELTNPNLPSDRQVTNRRPLKIGLCRTPKWQEAEEISQLALHEAAERLSLAGAVVEPLVLSEAFTDLFEAHDLISDFRAVQSLSFELEHYPEMMSSGLMDKLIKTKKINHADVERALKLRRDCSESRSELFKNYDLIMTLSSPGCAPTLKSGELGASTFSKIWTLLGMPSINIPLPKKHALPIGIQLVGQFQRDDQLLQLAKKVYADIHQTSCT